MKRLRYGLALSLFFLAASVLAAPIKITEIEGVSEYRLDNGLKVLLAPDPSRPTMTVNVTYLVGSRHEGYGETGMAHLLEHLLFKGSALYPDINLELSRRGMRPNGLTTYDRTQYFETFAASDDNLAWALGMEADRMVNSFVSEADLRSEMTVVRNEMERGQNSPASVLREKVLASAYQWHAYGRSIIGARSDVENVRIANLQAFYRTYYQPDNAVLTVAGKIDLPRTLMLIEQTFGAIPKPQRALPALYTVEPPQEGARSVRLERRGEGRLLQLVYHTPAGAHPDAVTLELLMQILADTPDGRLHKSLVETGLGTAVSGWSAKLFDPGYAVFSVRMASDANVEAARTALLARIEDIAAQPVTDEEVSVAKRALQVGYEQTVSDTGRLAMALSGAIALGDWRLYFWQRDHLARIDAAEVNRVAQQYFRPDNRTLGEFAPVEAARSVTIPAAPDVQALLQDYRGNAAMQNGEAFDPSPANIAARMQQHQLANGMQLALLPKKTRGETVRAVLMLNFGTAQTLLGKGDIAETTAAMLLRGTQRTSRAAITRQLDSLGSQISIGGSGQQVTVNVEARRDSLAPTLRLLREILREPAFQAAELEQLQKQSRSAIEAARIEPESVSDMVLARHFNDWQADDIRYVQTFDEQLQGLKRIRRSDLQRFHARFYAASHAQFAAVGDFDVPGLTGLVTELFGDWQNSEPYQRLDHPFRMVPPLKQVLETPEKQNAVFRAALRIPVGEDHPDYPALRVASHILGGGFISSRLANRLRQQEGISYSVWAALSASRQENLGSLSVYAIYAPQYRQRMEAAFSEEMQRAWREGFADDEVSNAKQAILQAAQLNRAQDANLAWMMAADLFYGQDWQRILALEEKMRTLTRAEVHAALRRHIDPAGFTQIYAGDFVQKRNPSRH